MKYRWSDSASIIIYNYYHGIRGFQRIVLVAFNRYVIIRDENLTNIVPSGYL